MSSKITLNQVYLEYFDFAEFLLSEQTLKTDIAYFKKHIQYDLGKKTIKEITFYDIQILCNKLLRSEYKVKTVKNILSKIRVVFKYAIKRKYINDNPALDVELPKFDNKIYFSFNVKTQEKFIRVIKENTNKPTNDIFFFLLHGRRKNEVLNLTWDMVDLEQKIYYIPPQINKAKRNMTYEMTDELYQRLKILHRNYQEKIEKSTDKHVFLNPDTAKPYKDIRKSWKTLLKINNLPYIRLHDIRHLIGTYSINYLNIPVEHVSFALGHTNIETTQKYITKKPEIARNVINSILKSDTNIEK